MQKASTSGSITVYFRDGSNDTNTVTPVKGRCESRAACKCREHGECTTYKRHGDTSFADQIIGDGDQQGL